MANTGCLKEIATMTFDPLRYEATAREPSQGAADARHTWEMLVIAGIRPGSHLLHPRELLMAGGTK
jgi:hypothetical protein